MNKEEIDLIQSDLVLTYIKNKDYSTYYRRRTDGMAIDNDILNNEDNLYITTINKYKELQQENKQLKDNWNKLKEYVNEVGSPFTNEWNYIQIEGKIIYVEDVLDKMQELEKGDSNG